MTNTDIAPKLLQDFRAPGVADTPAFAGNDDAAGTVPPALGPGRLPVAWWGRLRGNHRWLGSGLGLGSGIVAAMVLAAQAMITGAMHEDGLADTADGLWGGWDKARRLEIMKDSHIGTYGVMALILTVLVRWSALACCAAKRVRGDRADRDWAHGHGCRWW